MQSSPVDWDAFTQNCAGDQRLMTDVLAGFHSRLAAALPTLDVSAAVSLKGIFLTLGAQQALTLLRELQVSAELRIIESFRDELEHLITAIAAFL